MGKKELLFYSRRYSFCPVWTFIFVWCKNTILEIKPIYCDSDSTIIIWSFAEPLIGHPFTPKWGRKTHHIYWFRDKFFQRKIIVRYITEGKIEAFGKILKLPDLLLWFSKSNMYRFYHISSTKDHRQIFCSTGQFQNLSIRWVAIKK